MLLLMSPQSSAVFQSMSQIFCHGFVISSKDDFETGHVNVKHRHTICAFQNSRTILGICQIRLNQIRVYFNPLGMSYTDII